MKVILPKTLVDLAQYPGHPLLYLGGPILGAPDWQYEACQMIERRVPDCFVATPRRYGPQSVLWPSRAQGISDYFVRQVLWERYFMRLAGDGTRLGCLIFWLCCEDPRRPRTDGNPYAMDTRGELGEWRATMKYCPRTRLVIGAEENFPGLDQIRANFNDMLGYEFPIHSSLHETVEQALRIGHLGSPKAV